MPNINWETFVPAELMSHWNVISAWPVAKRLFPTKEEDEAAEALADFFNDNAADIPLVYLH